MRSRRHKLQVSTFPFLAVLLCAMGSLILVLLVMDRKAHQAAQARARREAARLAEESAQNEIARRAEAEQKRRQVESAWQQKREALHTKLTQEQMDLALQMRTVREKLGEIAARLRYEQDTGTELRHKIQSENSRLQTEERLLATLRTTAGQTQAQSQESSKALRRMTLDLLQMEQALKDLKAAREKEQHTFSVVPYHGRRGENRRPIYVECTAEGVIFHPERRAMPVFSRDYLLGRDQPDDSSDDVRGEVKRRIARQRAKTAGAAGAAEATPYLLLLVRPDGISTYHQLQHVLKDMILDFGYEFIDADWVLDFPAEDDTPSAQPWMASARSSPPAAPPAPTSNSNNPHPVGLSSSRGPGALSGSGALGFRTGDGQASGNWLRSSGGQGGSGPFASGGAPGGGSASSSGSGNVVASSGGLPGTGSGGNSLGGVPGPNGNNMGQNGVGSPLASSGGGGDGSQGGLPGSGFGSGGGNGYGHPAAMAPALGSTEGGSGTAGGVPGEPGTYVLRGSGRSYVPGAPTTGSPMPNGPGVPGLGPPTALSSGMGQSGAGASGAMGASGSGIGPSGNGLVGSNVAGVPGTGAPGSGTPGLSPPPGVSPDGRYTVARGNGGEGAVPSDGSGGASGSATGGNSSGQPAIMGSSGSGGSTGTWQRGGTGGASGGTAGANLSGQPGVTGTGNPGRAFGGPTGQTPSRPSGMAGPPAVNARGGSPSGDGAAVYSGIDPLRPQPPPGSQSPSGEANDPSSNPPNPARKKVVLRGLGGSNGSAEPNEHGPPGDDRFATPSNRPAPVRKPAPLRPGWVHGGRDWVIYVECRADGVVLYPAEKQFTLAEAASPASTNPLFAAIKKMIDRRQSLRRPGEPPYYPQVRLLVRPENVTTFLMVYPALEALPVPKKRQNLAPEDDVRDIVTDPNP